MADISEPAQTNGHHLYPVFQKMQDHLPELTDGKSGLRTNIAPDHLRNCPPTKNLIDRRECPGQGPAA